MTTIIPFELVAGGDRESGLEGIQASTVPRTHALRRGDSVFIVLKNAAKCVHSESGRHTPDQVLPITGLVSEMVPQAEHGPQVRVPSPWLAWIRVVPFLIWNWRDVVRAFLPEHLEDPER